MGKPKQRSTANWLKFTKSFAEFKKKKKRIQKPKQNTKTNKQKNHWILWSFVCCYEQELKSAEIQARLKKEEGKKGRKPNTFSYLTESKSKKPRWDYIQT